VVEIVFSKAKSIRLKQVGQNTKFDTLLKMCIRREGRNVLAPATNVEIRKGFRWEASPTAVRCLYESAKASHAFWCWIPFHFVPYHDCITVIFYTNLIMKVSENISDRKVELAHWLLEVEDEAIIAKIEELKKSTLKDWWDELTPEEKMEVEEAEADVEAGRVVSQDELLVEALSWIKK
jgi:hypothetical protein